jgi:RNA polymerase sigma-70 factor (ECF subfamily)
MSRESDAIQHAAAEFIRDRHRLAAFAGGLLRDAHATEDVIQEVWVRLAAEVEKGTVLENQPAWCRAVARNLILKHWRARKTAKVVADSEVMEAFLAQVDQAFAETDDGPDDEWRRRQQALDDCVAALPEKSRHLLSLRYEARRPVEEVARAMGQSFDAATKALYRLRQALVGCVERKLAQPTRT